MDDTLREKLNNYITTLYAQEDDALRRIQSEATRNNMPEISILPFEGRLLQLLVEMVGAKNIVEIGTLAGYSGTWMARALADDGKLITVEVEPKHAEVARANFDYAGVGQKVELRQGDARAILNQLSGEGPFDMVFIDANKDGYPFYLDWAVDNLRTGGLVAAHNALRHGSIIDPQDEWDFGMVEFNKRIAEHPQLSSFIISVGDGMAVALKKA